MAQSSQRFWGGTTPDCTSTRLCRRVSSRMTASRSFESSTSRKAEAAATSPMATFADDWHKRLSKTSHPDPLPMGEGRGERSPSTRVCPASLTLALSHWERETSLELDPGVCISHWERRYQKLCRAVRGA